MSVGQLPEHIREFAEYLNELVARLDQATGWCGVFWSRDPDGMRACLDGAEVPPWDVVQALLHDLAADAGPGVAEAETPRARALHAASVAAHDERPGGRELLSDRLDLMLQEQRFALERQHELARALAVAATPDEVDRVHLDLAWVRDDHERAVARCKELRQRMERLDRARAPQWVDFGTGPDAAAPTAPPGTTGPPPGGAYDPVTYDPTADAAYEPAYEPSYDAAEPVREAAAPGRGRGASGDAGVDPVHDRTAAGYDTQAARGRTVAVYDGHGPDAYASDAYEADTYASDTYEADAYDSAAHDSDGYDSDSYASVAYASDVDARGSEAYDAVDSAYDTAAPSSGAEPEPPPVPAAPRVPAQGTRSRLGGVLRRPRGARFAGSGGAAARGHPRPSESPDDERATVDAVRALIRLRGEGRSGEAHGVLVEAAGWPAARLPLFAEELHHAGLAADWATLLWEAASLPPDRLVAVADALAAAGRADDCRQLLRQGVVRPPQEIAEALLALADAGREREARALLDAYVRMRSAEDVAACAHTDPQRLIPQLLDTARAVSDRHQWDLVHALRVAGLTT
ncbi:hypothetical protein [Streptomyces sp. G45]|uniref:hypothetical protein n=1 Tax=Streptomyces sp. G45 TaxID=3406627 RepID=UPI003C2601AC